MVTAMPRIAIAVRDMDRAITTFSRSARHPRRCSNTSRKNICLPRLLDYGRVCTSAE
jgi:hypothetical protein